MAVPGNSVVNSAVLFREVHKNAWLRRLPTEEKKIGAHSKKGERVWCVFCVHDDVEPFIEIYADQKMAAAHKPDWCASLSHTLHVSPTICAHDDQFEFVVTLPDTALRLSAPSWEVMMEWVDSIGAKLREMHVLSPRENVYSRQPESRAPLLPTRDPNSPLPPPPPSVPPMLVPGVEAPPSDNITVIQITPNPIDYEPTTAEASSGLITSAQTLINCDDDNTFNDDDSLEEDIFEDSVNISCPILPRLPCQLNRTNCDRNRNSQTNTNNNTQLTSQLIEVEGADSPTTSNQSHRSTRTINNSVQTRPSPPADSASDNHAGDSPTISNRNSSRATSRTMNESVHTRPPAPVGARNDSVHTRTSAADSTRNDSVHNRQTTSDIARNNSVHLRLSASDSTRNDSVHTRPSASDSARTDSVPKRPTASDSARNDSVHTRPSSSDSARTDSVHTRPSASDSSRNDSVHTKSSSSDSARNDSVHTRPSALDSARTDSVHTRPSLSDSARNDSMHTRPSASDGARTDSVHTRPSSSDSARTDSVHTRPSASDNARNNSRQPAASDNTSDIRVEPPASPVLYEHVFLASSPASPPPSLNDDANGASSSPPPLSADLRYSQVQDRVVPPVSAIRPRSGLRPNRRRSSDSSVPADRIRRLQAPPHPFRQPAATVDSGASVTLRERQVMQLQREMTHQGGVRLQLRRKDCLGSIALVDAFGATWVAGWKQKEHPMLYNALHIGDKVISVAGVRVQSSCDAHKLIRGAPSLYVALVIRRLPWGRVLALRRESEGQSVGLVQEGGTAEIKEVVAGGLAAQQGGLPPRAPSVEHPRQLTTWSLTEINGRPLNLFFKDNEVRDRLNAVGLDISFLVQPTDLVKQIRRQLKALRGYKDYIVQ